jgi:hypothetical protein
VNNRPAQGISGIAWLVLAATLGGCATPGVVLIPARERSFDFERDTFAFLNDVEYEYRIDVASRTTVAIGRDPDAEYTQRCFAMSRTARQFMQFARFDPALPPLTEEGYRERVRQLLSHDPSEREPVERIVFPGYPNLRSFSARHEAMVKKEIGGNWLTYYWQRGHWRIIFPFSDENQATMAENLLAEIRVRRPPVVHLITFPELTINHAVLLFGAEEKGDQIHFRVYDPNDNKRPRTLVYDRRARQFEYPPQFYFAGGPVNVYEIYKSFAY